MRAEREPSAAQLLDWIEGQLARVERLDALERERGGRWRESELLAPG